LWLAGGADLTGAVDQASIFVDARLIAHAKMFR